MVWAKVWLDFPDDKKITILIFSSKPKTILPYTDALYNIGLLMIRAQHTLKPGNKGCWNWKSIDKKNRAKEWYWVAFEGGHKWVGAKRLGEGCFPIGSAIYFSGWMTPENRFDIYYRGKPWKYWKSPWNHKKKPWKTYKYKKSLWSYPSEP